MTLSLLFFGLFFLMNYRISIISLLFWISIPNHRRSQNFLRPGQTMKLAPLPPRLIVFSITFNGKTILILMEHFI